MQLDRLRLLDLFAQGFVVNRLQILKDMRRDSLLALRKNLRRSRNRSNCMVTA